MTIDRSRAARRRLLPIVFGCLVLAKGAAGRDRELKLELRFVPQDTIGAPSATLQSGIADYPVDIVLVEGRTIVDKSLVGQGQGDNDQAIPVRSTDDVIQFLKRVLIQTAGKWGVRVEEAADLVLEVRLTQLFANESDKAFGSTYNSNAAVAYVLKTRSGSQLYAGSTTGGTNRYGKSRNRQNLNEVLSDAIKEAFTHMFDDSALQDAWLGRNHAPAKESRVESSSTTISLEELLAELVKLNNQSFSTELMLAYVRQKTLTTSMTAAEVLKWKDAGLPEAVILAALELPLIPQPRQ